MNHRRHVPAPRAVRGALVGALVVAALVIPATSASATSALVTGQFVCVTSTSFGGTVATVVRDPQALQTTISVPASYDVATPAAATVAITAASGATLPLSVPVALTAVNVTTSVSVEVYTSPQNDPTLGTGLSVPSTATSAAAAVGPTATQLPDTPWVSAGTVAVTLPPAAAGLRQWIRVRTISYDWSSAQASGATTCALSTIPTTILGTSVEEPTYGLTRQYPSAPAITSASGTSAQITALFGGTGARTVVTGTVTPPAGSTCTVTLPATSCDTAQTVNATVTPGSLTQQADVGSTGNPSSTSVLLKFAS